MAELDKVPVKNSIQVETVKLDESVLESIRNLNNKSSNIVLNVGTLYLRKKELIDELERIENTIKLAEEEFKSTTLRLNEIGEEVDEKYPQARINIQDGTVTYQPGAPTRKQQLQQSQQQEQQLNVAGDEAPKIVNQ
jgi:hypothetical protein